MRYAVIKDNVVINVILAEADEAALNTNWVETETALIGDTYTNETFDPVRILSTPAETDLRTWNATEVRNGLSLQEKIKWDNNKSETIITAKVEFETPRIEAETEDILQMLVDAGDISTSSMVKIMGISLGVSRV